MVDLTCIGIAPRPEALAEIARNTGLNINSGCGYYTQDTHPPALADRSVEQIADEMIRDLTQGIGGTRVRAGGMGEIGTSSPMLPDEAKCLHASALAFTRT